MTDEKKYRAPIIVFDQEEDGRWIADAGRDFPGAMAYGATKDEARENVNRIIFAVLLDREARGA